METTVIEMTDDELKIVANALRHSKSSIKNGLRRVDTENDITIMAQRWLEINVLLNKFEELGY